ncbi:hypothetical protein BpHYR1_022241 [Brachionus plicatilis]|uniref:Uncharacterized protein n=1 Tax=Brachionus plicatilis TaxID=10195 RepID=A0A3M7T5R3_BRAPC|nr:hypothetical protein BpHYR1_022241 [Brachionus plicatilis]
MLRATPIEGGILTLWAEEEVEVLRPREHVTPPKEPPVKTHTTNNVPLQPQTIPVAPINSQATLKPPAVSAQNDNVIHHQNPHPEPPVINIYPKVVVKADTESLISRLGLGEPDCIAPSPPLHCQLQGHVPLALPRNRPYKQTVTRMTAHLPTSNNFFFH